MPENKATLDKLNAFSANTMSGNLGIEFTEVGPDYVKGKMPVDQRTVQPFGILHGGASVALAETLGSVAAQIKTNFDKACFGVEINANHLKSVANGFVYGTATPVRVGRTIQVWNIEIVDDNEDLICVSRITVMVKEKKAE